MPHGRAVLLGPLTLLLSARVPLPHKVSYSVSSCVSSDTSFPSVRQEPTFRPWKRAPFLQQLHPQASSLHLRGAKAERKGVRKQLCAPASSDLLSCAFSLSILPSLALQERCISQTLPAPFMSALHPLWASLVAQTVKNLPVMQETRVQSLGQEDPPEKGRATHSSIIAWRIPWTEEPDGLQSMGSQRVRHDLVTK